MLTYMPRTPDIVHTESVCLNPSCAGPWCTWLEYVARDHAIEVTIAHQGHFNRITISVESAESTRGTIIEATIGVLVSRLNTDLHCFTKGAA